MRFGLCCIFIEEPIRFRTTTARALVGLPRSEQYARLSDICCENAKSLLSAVQTVQSLGIGAFRVTSTFFPRYTHPAVGYTLTELPAGQEIEALLAEVNQLRGRLNIRLSFHPDQFVSISSLSDDVVLKSTCGAGIPGTCCRDDRGGCYQYSCRWQAGGERGDFAAVPE